jgi:hypothetical protein
MHGTLELTKRVAARRRWIKAGIIALAVLAGIVAGLPAPCWFTRRWATRY